MVEPEAPSEEAHARMEGWRSAAILEEAGGSQDCTYMYRYSVPTNNTTSSREARIPKIIKQDKTAQHSSPLYVYVHVHAHAHAHVLHSSGNLVNLGTLGGLV